MIMMNHIPSNAFIHAGADREVFCGCGEAFTNHDAFKEHNLLDHQGQYIDGSSHFLSKFTLVVLPARTQQTKVYHQDVLLQDFDFEDDLDVHTKRKVNEHQEFAVQPNLESNEAKKSSNRFGEVSLEKLALIRTENCKCGHRYYCGNCRQRNFSNATEFCLHLRDICPVVSKRSTHYLTFLDYDHEIQKYMNQTHEPKQKANKSILRTFLKKIFGTNVDHYDLPFFCGPCRQKFPDSSTFWVHVLRLHQGQIHQSSSHVFLRFRCDFSMCLTEKLHWIHDEETAFCPCDPNKKMTVANLIKHLRQMHHGVSPFYENELIDAVISDHQNAFLHKTFDNKTVQNKSRQTDEQQYLEDDDEPVEEQVHQTLHSNTSDTITKEIANIRLVRNPAIRTMTLKCGNCQKNDFKDAEQLIIHFKNICKLRHPKSSHFLIDRDFNKEIKDYQQREKHGHSSQNRNRVNQAISRIMNIASDHSDLTLECGVCRQIFEPHPYYLHIIGRHSEIIDGSSSHIILRFHWRTRSHLFITDRIPWANHQEIYFCPCKPIKKMTMESLIKHVRQVHMGISPIYDISVDISKRKPQFNCSKIYKNVQVHQKKAGEQKLLKKDEKVETQIQDGFHQNFPNAAQNNTSLLRLFRSPEGDHHHIFYCANCRKHDFRESAQFITHLRDICSKRHPKSSHFLVVKDIKKEIEDYPRKKDHRLSKIYEYSKKHAEFIHSFLGTTYDHSDLTFECQICRQIFKEGSLYLAHTQKRHQDIIHPTSSHIVLRFPSGNCNRRIHIYISDRVSWINEDMRYYCPCKPDKKMTMRDLIKHVREVHMGISPIYEFTANNSNRNNQDQSAYSSKISENVQAFDIVAQEQQIIENNQKVGATQMKQALALSCSDAIQEENDIGHLKLTRSPEANNNYIFLCGYCRKHDFNGPFQFITHLKNICKYKHDKSSHYLVEKDIRKEIGDYQQKKDHFSAAIKGKNKKHADFITSFLGTTYDHSDLTFECYPCRQIFQNGSTYYSHFRSKHCEKLHPNSSHIIFKFPQIGNVKRKFIYISDRVPWINEDAVYYCPCEPNNKLTMENLIRHVRTIHHGISPDYQLEQEFLHASIDLQDNASYQDVICESVNATTINKIQPKYKAKEPENNWKYATIENTIPKKYISRNLSAPQEETTNNRLLLNILYKMGGLYYYYCGVCRNNSFNNPTDFITHIMDSCSYNHPKSSHFLASIDFKKEIQDYQMKMDHNAETKKDGKICVKFIKKILGTTYDHSDLTFDCYTCRQIFKEGRNYSYHALYKHSQTVDSKSSHIILRFISSYTQKNIYISDRVPWVNNDERCYCPCVPEKRLTMASLINHVREVHKGISPPYKM